MTMLYTRKWKKTPTSPKHKWVWTMNPLMTWCLLSRLAAPSTKQKSIKSVMRNLWWNHLPQLGGDIMPLAREFWCTNCDLTIYIFVTTHRTGIGNHIITPIHAQHFPWIQLCNISWLHSATKGEGHPMAHSTHNLEPPSYSEWCPFLPQAFSHRHCNEWGHMLG